MGIYMGWIRNPEKQAGTNVDLREVAMDWSWIYLIARGMREAVNNQYIIIKCAGSE